MSEFVAGQPAAESDIAIIGMSGRFPGARTVAEYWRNLRDGVESVRFFTAEELRASGIPTFLSGHPDYVPARATLEDVQLFDASFFGFSPREAALMDPQHRIFLEVAWEALEDAGYDSHRYDGAIGVYAGASTNSYLFSVYSHMELINAVNDFQTIISNDKDFLATRVSWHLGLRGPSMAVQTACSTSLVAVHLACQSLLTGECDMALAGGVSIKIPQESGYVHQKGAILSSDGHCRAFDARADGTVSGNGAGVVVLKRVSRALDDGDSIRAVIRGSAVNNDGSFKVGFTAPSVSGQAAAIAEALLIAGVNADEIGYIETHGTGTRLGDPIEIAALNEVFRAQTNRRGLCPLGSAKTNIGHLDAAAGVAGLIKAVSALQHRQIPPSLHFERPNPEIDFADGPFFVNRTLSDWDADGRPRRAGVSSFGIGGTNAHVVLEEAPAHAQDSRAEPWQLLVLSARSPSALEEATARLAAHLQRHPALDVGGVACTLQLGRRAFEHRRMLVCRDRAEAIDALQQRDPRRTITGARNDANQRVSFLFPGQATQYPEMTRELYEHEPTFRLEVDRCAELLQTSLGGDLRSFLYPSAREPTDTRSLEETAMAQPAIFVVEYALARLWIEWGLRPHAMIGHSLGEYVAACLADVFSLEDALTLVAARGRLMQALPEGAMLSVGLPPAQLMPRLGDRLALAAINAPELCVASGPPDAVDALEADLLRSGVECKRLRTRRAFHSAVVDPMVEEFARIAGEVALQPPRLPFVSCMTGTWIRDEEATSPRYWARHLRETVRFSEGIRPLLEQADLVFVEVGPGRTLATLARAQPGASGRIILSSLSGAHGTQSESASMLTALGRLWVAGVAVDWSGFRRNRAPRRVPLPTYPFERRRHWIDSVERYGGADRDTRPPADPIVTPQPRPPLRNSYVAPESDTEKALAAVWQELLGHERIGVHDDFFDLGGHSLMATRLVARLRETFAVELPLQEIFRGASIAELAKMIEFRIVQEVEAMSEEEARRALG